MIARNGVSVCSRAWYHSGIFDAVQSASLHIAQDDQAYGLLCGWISGVLEGRHQKQDELLAFVAENP